MIIHIFGLSIILFYIIKIIFIKNPVQITSKKKVTFNEKNEIKIIQNVLDICNKDDLWYNSNDYRLFWLDKQI